MDIAARLKELAGPPDSVKVRIAKAARLAGLTETRAFDIWYGKARRVEPDEKTAILTALVEKRLSDERNELHELKISLAKLEARVSQTQAALSGALADRDFQTIERALGLAAQGG